MLPGEWALQAFRSTRKTSPLGGICSSLSHPGRSLPALSVVVAGSRCTLMHRLPQRIKRSSALRPTYGSTQQAFLGQTTGRSE
jgi:hypothetical protein